MHDITVTPTMTPAQLRTAELAANALGRGTTEDAPLRVKVEAGTHALTQNPLTLRSPFRLIDARGAVFQGTGTPKGNGKLAMLSGATHVECEGGEVVGADVLGLTSKLGTSIQVLHYMTFRDFDSWEDGLGCSNFESDTLKVGPRLGVPTKDEPWITRLVGCKFIDWAGSVSTHPVYLHGRYGELHALGCTFAGGRGSSALKSTRNVLTVRDSLFYSESALLRGEPPTGGKRALNKLIDQPTCGDTIISGCEFHGAYQNGVGGLYYMIALRTRRDLWSDDVGLTPADVHWEQFVGTDANPVRVTFRDSNVSASAVGVHATLGSRRLATPPVSMGGDAWAVNIQASEVPVNGRYQLTIRADDGATRLPCKPITLTFLTTATHRLVSSFYDATLEGLGRYLDEAWWEALGDLEDPQNPWSHKAWISGNRFVRHEIPGHDQSKRGPLKAIWNFGCYPVNDVRQFSVENKLHPVPRAWADRSTAFLCENEFVGWLPGEVVQGVSSDGDYRAGFDVLHGINPPAPLDPAPLPRILRVEPIMVPTLPDWFHT